MENENEQQLIFSGRSVEEALKVAREKLDLDPYVDLDYEVLEEGKKRKFLFFGGTKETTEVRILIKFGGKKATKENFDDRGNTIKQMVEDVWQEQRQPRRATSVEHGRSKMATGRNFSDLPRRPRAFRSDIQNEQRLQRENRAPSPKPPMNPVLPEVMEKVGVELNALFQKMGFDIKASVELSIKNGGIIRVNSQGQDSEWLLSQSDEGLRSIEELMSKMVKARFGEDKACRLYFVGRQHAGEYSHHKPSTVDQASLKEQVLACLDKIKQTGQSEFLGPMNSYERRLVHTLVAEAGNYVTESVGDGHRKKVKISMQ